MRERDGIEALILGGTELPLLLTDSSPVGIPFLDTTQIHVNAILKQALE
jgi:aspartate racemase